jgi:hypothetical protein
VAQEFDFRNPLLGINTSVPFLEEEEEKEEDLLEKSAFKQKKPVEEFSFADPLKDIPASPSSSTPTPRSTSNLYDATIKPFAGFAEEADNRRPDGLLEHFENLAYFGRAIGPAITNIPDRVRQMYDGFKLQSATGEIEKAEGSTARDIGDAIIYFDDEAFFGRFKTISKEDLKQKKIDLKNLENETFEQFKKLEGKIKKRQRDAGLGEYGASLSTGLESMLVIGGGVLANIATRGKLSKPLQATTLTYFGAQTKGVAYTEARRDGLSHQDAKNYSNIQGGLEVATELIPVFRYFRKTNSNKLKDIFVRGAGDVFAETSTEVLNSMLQEVNSVYFGLETELADAYENRNNPLYEGRTQGEILADIAGHTLLSSSMASGSISSARAGGEVLYSKEISDFIKKNKDDPNIEEFVTNFNAMVNNISINHAVIDKAAIQALDPEGPNTITVNDILSESYLDTNFIKLEGVPKQEATLDTLAVESVVDKNIPLVQQVDEKYPDIKPTFSFDDPLNKKVLPSKKAISGIDPNSSEALDIFKRLTADNERQASSLPENSIFRNTNYVQDEVDIINNRIILPRRFHNGVLKDLPDEIAKRDVFIKKLGVTRDLNLTERQRLSEATVDLFKSGMPLDIFSDLRFIGALSFDSARDIALGEYLPLTQSVHISPSSGLANQNYSSKLGAKTQLRHVFAHELAHHIDYGIGKKFGSNSMSYSPAIPTSPFFDMPNVTVEGGVLNVDESGGFVMREALNIFQKSRQEPDQNNFYRGGLLSYPFSHFFSQINVALGKMNPGMINTIKSETFAQMHALYYTNKDFLRDNAPETYKLIEDINDAISADSPREKNARVLQTLRSSRAPRSVQSNVGTRLDDDARSVDTDQQTTGRLEEQTESDDRIDIRPSVPRLNSTALLDFIKQNPEGFTVDPITLESPSSGFAVAPVKALEIVLDQNKMTEADAIQFYNNVADLSEQMDQPVFAGGWLNPKDNKYYLDATIVFDNIEDALYTADIPTLNREGKLEKQKAIFDLETFNETETEQGIQELKDSGRFSSEARRRQETRITELSKLFEESRNRSSQEQIKQEPVEDPQEQTLEPLDPDRISSLLTKSDSKALFKLYGWLQIYGVDKLDRLKNFQSKLKPYFDEKMQDFDILGSTDTFFGKVKTKLDDATEESINIAKFLEGPIDEKASRIDRLLRKDAISLDFFGKFLRNLHAPERNKFINNKYSKELPDLEKKLEQETDESKKPAIKAQITKRKNVLNKYKDSGSGIKTETAIQNLKDMGIAYNNVDDTLKVTNNQGKKLMEAFDLFQNYQAKTRELYVQNDLISEDTIADWDSTYKYYSPQVGFAVDTIEGNRPNSSGTGRTLYGHIIPQAKGRTTEAGNPFLQAVVRRSEAAVLGERNEINKELALLIEEFPEEGIWKVVGANKYMKPHRWDGKESLIAFKENGKTKFISLRDERLARGFDDFGNSSAIGFLRPFRFITSTLSALYTTYSPEFIATNFSKDYQTGIYNLLKEQEMKDGRAYGKNLVKNAFNPKNIFYNGGVLRKGYFNKLDLDSEDGKYFRAFLEEGSQTGYVNAKDIEVIEKEMLLHSRAHSGLPVNPKRLYSSTTRLVEKLNNVAENVSRFSVFREFIIDRGGIENASKKDLKDAAVLAKNLTINFNRSGLLGPYVNALYAFANASVQGNVNFFRGFVPVKFDADGKIVMQKIGKAATGIMAGGVGLGALVAFYNMFVGGEDDDGKLWIDKIPPHKQERFLVVMLPVGRRKIGKDNREEERKKAVWNDEKNRMEVDGTPVSISIPLPYGYNLFFNMGRMAVEFSTEQIAGYKRRSQYELARDITGNLITNFSPVGIGYDKDGASLPKTFIPTFAKPVVDVALNEKWTGAPIYKENIYGGGLPQSSQKMNNTEEFYREFTMMMNKVDVPALGVKGGGEFDAGTINISPDKMKYLMQSYLGGLYSTIERSYGLVERINDATQGIERDLPFNAIPFGRIFITEPEQYLDSYEYNRHKDFLVGTPDKPGLGVITSYKAYEDAGKIAGNFKELKDFIERTNFKNSYLDVHKELLLTEKKIKKLREQKRELDAEWANGDRAFYMRERPLIDQRIYAEQRLFNQYARQILPREGDEED